MSEFTTQIISGLILTTILELCRRKSLGKPLRYNDEAMHSSKLHAQVGVEYRNHSHSSIKAIIRLVISPLIGFFFAAATAGILQAEGQERIPLKSSFALALIIIWTFIIWQLLFRFGPLKGIRRVHSSQNKGKI